MAKISILASVSAFAALAGWAAPQVPKTAAPVHQRTAAPAQPARPRQSDAQIEANIRARFAKSKVAPEKFTVHVQGGVATIEAKTDVVQHKGSATRMAKTCGALAVKQPRADQ